MKRNISATINASKAKKLASNKKQKKSSEEHEVLVTWSAIEPGPHKRWWWYIGFCLVMIWLIVLFIFLRAWLFSILVAVAAIAILVTYTRTPNQLHYRLNEKTLVVNKQSLNLDDFYAYAIEEARPFIKNPHPSNILLLPKRLFGIPSQVTMPTDADESEKILKAFNEVLSFHEAKGYLTSTRILDRIAHWLRLN